MSSFMSDETHSVFLFSGERELVDEDRARQLLEQVKHIDQPTKIQICGKSYSEGAASVLGERFLSFTNVSVLDISDIIAGRMEVEALNALKNICEPLGRISEHNRITYVDLSDNALGKPGIEACEAVLKKKTIQHLLVCNTGLSAEASEKLAEVLLSGGCPPLLQLHFHNNMSGNGGAMAIATVVEGSSGTLADFRYSTARTSSAGCHKIAEALLGVRGLLKLDMSDNSFGEIAAAKLSEALKLQRGLTYLNLRDSGLTEKGTKAVAAALPGLPIQFLDLSGDDVSPDVLSSKFIEHLTSLAATLQELYLDDNEIGSEMDGVNALASAMRTMRQLRMLSVCTSEITAAGGIAIARAVSKLPNFKLLRLDGNSICERGLKIIQSLLSAKGITLGDMEDNDIDGDDDIDEYDAEDGEEEGEVVDAAAEESCELNLLSATLAATSIDGKGN